MVYQATITIPRQNSRLANSYKIKTSSDRVPPQRRGQGIKPFCMYYNVQALSTFFFFFFGWHKKVLI